MTTKRDIIVSGVFARKISRLDQRTLTDVALTERSDRSGTITFGPQHPFAWMYGGMQWSGVVLPSLEMIEDARRVFKLIREARDAK